MGFHSLVKEQKVIHNTHGSAIIFYFHRNANVGTSVGLGAAILWDCDAVGVSNDPYISIVSIHQQSDGNLCQETQEKFYEFDFIQALAWLEENTA